MKSWLEKTPTEINLAHNKRKSAVPETVIRTLNKSNKC